MRGEQVNRVFERKFLHFVDKKELKAAQGTFLFVESQNNTQQSMLDFTWNSH